MIELRVLGWGEVGIMGERREGGEGGGGGEGVTGKEISGEKHYSIEL